MIRIILADDQRLMTDGLKTILEVSDLAISLRIMVTIQAAWLAA